MTEYRVIWEIDIDADTPQQAAEKAWETMRKPDSTANVFRVVSPDTLTHVDLEDLDEKSTPYWPT
ncbi:hypothetical protein [Rhodococcus koreensis]